jgi:ribosomal protein S18 acetylase RimI-like enzyme
VDVRRGTRDDFETVAKLTGNPEWARSRWDVPSFEPERHLWLADGAFGALYAPDEAVVRGDAALIPPLLASIERQARTEAMSQLASAIPESDEQAWRAYEASGFVLATVVLEMEVRLGGPPREYAAPAGVTLRSYTDADAHAVHTLLDGAYTDWDEAYVPLAHDDWLAFMTKHDSFDPDCWFLAVDARGELAGVCLTWKEGWVKDLAVTEAARGHGLGESLLQHAFARFHGRGVRRVGLKVDARNPTGAIRLYERVGMRTVTRHRYYVKTL